MLCGLFDVGRKEGVSEERIVRCSMCVGCARPTYNNTGKAGRLSHHPISTSDSILLSDDA